MDSLTSSVTSCFAAFVKSLCFCPSEVMLFTSLVICPLFLFKWTAWERRASCVAAFIWCLFTFFYLPEGQLGAVLDIFLYSELHSSYMILNCRSCTALPKRGAVLMQIVCVIAYASRPCGGCYFFDDIRCMFKKKGGDTSGHRPFRQCWFMSLCFTSFCKMRGITSQNFTGSLRHFAAKLLSLPLLIPGRVEWEEQSDLQKDLALVRTAVSWVPVHCSPSLMGISSYSAGVWWG